MEGRPGENPTTENSLQRNNDWNAAIQSTVTSVLQNQDAAILQQSVGNVNPSSPPPGTTSMGILGDVEVQELPSFPPHPGTFLVGDSSTSKFPTSIRSSIPHSADDVHIANLRLSVFSRFDAEQQKIFRSRSVEVLNIRRRRGAVVLVAELPNTNPMRAQDRYVNEMEARIMTGHTYGEANNDHASATDSSPGLTVTQVRGARITSVSSGVAVSQIPNKESENPRNFIIGSVECSHQEFLGTMLGNSRPKGSLMYVTEVAVRTDARRCGAGAMLMRGVDEVAALRNVETIYLHVDQTNLAACAMYEKCGFRYLDKREPIYAQFTASLNLHDGAMHGRKHYLMCKDIKRRTTWLENDLF
jgi:ribosomal protein S18 acetylase RimI-like enzyme